MSEDTLERIVEEFLELQRSGRAPRIQDYVEQYPALADEIRASLTALAMVEGLKDGGTEVEHNPGPESDSIPDRIGDYRILDKIGRGGMGVVYRAEHQTLGREVALKVLLQHSVLDADARARFQREARAAARMHHTNIVPVYEVGEDDQRVFYAMQLINGAGLDLVIDELDRICHHTDATHPENNRQARADESASTAVSTNVLVEPLILDRTLVRAGSSDRQREPRSEPQNNRDQTSNRSQPMRRGSSSSNSRRRYCDAVARIGVQVAKALQYAHSRGLIHRDIKPSNLILDGSETVWITDFGLAKTEDDDLTRTGDHPGTIRYMSPERFQGRCGQSADTYALGLVLYELLTLRPAFDSLDRLQLMESIANYEPAKPSSFDRGIPMDLETIVLKAIEKSPDARYASAGEMGDDLQRFLNDEPIRARPISALERVSRWRRRNRSLAAALATIASLLLIGFLASAVIASYYRQMASTQRTLKEAAIDERENANANLYAAQISLASADLGVNKTLSAQAILESCAEQSDGNLKWEWHYLERHLNGELRRWTDHDEEFNELRLAIQPDVGLLVSTASTPSPHPPIRQDTLIVRDLDKGVIVNRIDVGQSQVRSLCVSPDGNLIATAHRDGFIRLWDRLTGEPLGENKSRINSNVIRVSINPRGSRLTASGSRKVELYSLSPLRLVDQFESKNRFPHDDQLFYVDRARPRVIVARNLETGQESDFFETTTENASFAISPDGEWLASVESPKGRTVHIWNPATNFNRQITVDDQVREVRFSPDGSSLMILFSNVIELWDPRTPARVCTISGHTQVVRSSLFIDNETLVTASDDATVRIWSAKQSLHRWKLDVGRSNALTFADASKLRIAFWRSKTLTSFRETTGVVLDEHHLDTATHPGLLRNDFRFSSDGARLVAPLKDRSNTLAIWESDSGEVLSRFPSNDRKVIAVAVDRDMKRVVCAYQTQPDMLCELKLFRASDQELTWSTELQMDLRSLAVSDDKRFLAACGDELEDHPTIVVWDLQEDRVVFKDRDLSYTQVAFHPTRNWLAATDIKLHVIKLVDLDEGASVWPDQPTSRAPADIAFSPNGERIAVVGYDGNVDLFDSATGHRLLLLESFSDPAGTRGFTPRVCFSRDGRRIAANSWSTVVTIWDAGPRASEMRVEESGMADPQ